MSLTANAVLYLQQTFPNTSFLKNIIIQDDGQGPYVKYWGIGSPQPTEAEINAAALSLVPKPIMPSDHDLIVIIYHDMKNGTKNLVTTLDPFNV